MSATVCISGVNVYMRFNNISDELCEQWEYILEKFYIEFDTI